MTRDIDYSRSGKRSLAAICAPLPIFLSIPVGNSVEMIGGMREAFDDF